MYKYIFPMYWTFSHQKKMYWTLLISITKFNSVMNSAQVVSRCRSVREGYDGVQIAGSPWSIAALLQKREVLNA